MLKMFLHVSLLSAEFSNTEVRGLSSAEHSSNRFVGLQNTLTASLLLETPNKCIVAQSVEAAEYTDCISADK